jgi:hypothetical protein
VVVAYVWAQIVCLLASSSDLADSALSAAAVVAGTSYKLYTQYLCFDCFTTYSNRDHFVLQEQLLAVVQLVYVAVDECACALVALLAPAAMSTHRHLLAVAQTYSPLALQPLVPLDRLGHPT